MNNLTKNKLLFWNDLVDDFHTRKEKSFLSVIFLTTLDSESNLLKEFRENSEGLYEPLLMQSDLLFYSVDGCFVGKYKDTFCLQYGLIYEENFDFVLEGRSEFENKLNDLK